MRAWNLLRLNPGWVVAAQLLALAGFPLLSQKVETKPHPSVDLSSYKTFAFEESTRGATHLFYKYPQAEQWVRESLQENLAASGYEHAGSHEPDLHIRISAGMELRERVVETGRVYNKFVEQFIEATLTVEFVDALSQEVIWTGIASDRAFLKRNGVDMTPEKARQKIRKALRKMIQRIQAKDGKPARH